MIERGATDLVLTRRHAHEDADLASELSRGGVRVAIVTADASDRTAMATLLASIGAHGRPLKGVFHLAGVPEDTALTEAQFEHGRRVLAPKVSGAWILHDLTRRQPLDFFVAFSSISAVWGSRGQPFYGAANHFLDAMTMYRHRSGLPMVTINWGPWSDGGMVDSDGLVRLERMGLRGMPRSVTLDRLARLLAAASGLRVVADVNWPIFKELFESRGKRPFLERIGAGTPTVAGQSDTDLALELRTLEPRAIRDRLTGFVQEQVGAVLGWISARAPDPWRGFFDLGMDSLMALDLKNRLQAALGLPLRATVVFNHSTINALAEHLALQLGPPPAGGPPAGPAPDVTAHADAIGDEDLLRLIDEQIDAIDRRARPSSEHA